ncbi:MAG: hypothetical protein QM674_06860 [Burkholderiaceae bacterium]
MPVQIIGMIGVTPPEGATVHVIKGASDREPVPYIKAGAARIDAQREGGSA